MRTLSAIFSALICVIGSFLITWLVWEDQIEGRAFECIDGGPFILSDGFWTNIDTHESAGDRLLPGWTWDKVRRAREHYQLAFFALAITSSVIVIRLQQRGVAREEYA